MGSHVINCYRPADDVRCDSAGSVADRCGPTGWDVLLQDRTAHAEIAGPRSMALSVEQTGLGYRVMRASHSPNFVATRSRAACSLAPRLSVRSTKLGFVQADPSARRRPRGPDAQSSVSGITGPVTWNSATPSWQSGRLLRQPTAFCRATHALMHPRSPRGVGAGALETGAKPLLDWIAARSVVPSRARSMRFAHGKVKNWFGGSSNATTQLLDAMHYRGLLRSRGAGRIKLIRGRMYAHTKPITDRVRFLGRRSWPKYAPLPAAARSVAHSAYVGAPVAR